MSTLQQGVGVVSAEGKFILDYMGTAMMDSRCMYSKEMMPWVISEILRFSGPTQVTLIYPTFFLSIHSVDKHAATN
jgi:hypothetical protein